jgi:hypothetical protein
LKANVIPKPALQQVGELREKDTKLIFRIKQRSILLFKQVAKLFYLTT